MHTRHGIKSIGDLREVPDQSPDFAVAPGILVVIGEIKTNVTPSLTLNDGQDCCEMLERGVYRKKLHRMRRAREFRCVTC